MSQGSERECVLAAEVPPVRFQSMMVHLLLLLMQCGHHLTSIQFKGGEILCLFQILFLFKQCML